MHHFIYIGLLVISLAGIAAYDMTHQKILTSAKRGILPIAASFFLLLCADIVGISLNIFQTNPAFVSGLYIVTPNLPIEELFLLFLLPYLSLIVSGILISSSKKIS